MEEYQAYRETRKRKGYTQPEAAYKLGVREETISRRENGAATIGLEAWAALRALPAKHQTSYMLSFINVPGLHLKALAIDADDADRTMREHDHEIEKEVTTFSDGSTYTQVMIRLAAPAASTVEPEQLAAVSC